MGGDLYLVLSASFASFSKTIYLAFGSFYGTAIGLATLMFMLTAAGFAMGKFKENGRKLLYTSMTLPFVVFFVFGSGSWFFSEVLLPTFSDFPRALTLWFLKAGGAPPNVPVSTGLDMAYAPLWTSMDKLDAAAEAAGGFSGISATAIKLWIAQGLLLAVHGLAYLTFYATQILSVASIYIFLAISPPFIFLAAFKETRGWFSSWLREMIKYSLMGPIAGVIMAASMHAVKVTLDSFAASILSAENPDSGIDIFTAEYGAALMMGFFTIYLLRTVPDIAASLTGGSQSSQGAFNIKGLSGKQMQSIGSGAGSAAKSAGNVIKNMRSGS